MVNERYFRVDVNEGSRSLPAYFYETVGGLADLKYGWAGYTSGMYRSVSAAVEEFRRSLQAKHDAAGDGIVVTVSDPVEVSRDEVERRRPLWGALVQKATALVKKEMEQSIYPADIIWGWEWIDDPASPAIVRLTLSDEFGSVATEFIPQDLKDERLMERRIGRLYGDLLGVRSRVIMRPIREALLEERAAQAAAGAGSRGAS